MAYRSTARIWLVLTVVCSVVGWGLFLVALIRTSAYTESHAMRGYEWIGGFIIVPLALASLCHMPRLQAARLSSPDMWMMHEQAMSCRIGIVVALTLTGVVVSGISVWIGWFAPPHHHLRYLPTPSLEARAVLSSHSSATPSPTPAPIVPHAATDPDTGVIMICHMASLCAAVVFGWLFETAPNAIEQQEADDDVGF